MSTSYSKDMKLESHTFGNSEACRVLVEMMNEGAIPVGDKHKVLAFITSSCIVLKDASLIEQRSLNRVLDLVKQDLIDKVNQMPYSAIFISHLRNVITYIYRKNLREVTWVITGQPEESRSITDQSTG